MNEVLYVSRGPLHYAQGDFGYKLIVEVDPGIVAYYRALMPPWVVANPQKYPPHISVVRKEIPINLDAWGKYEGREIEFHYSPIIHEGTVYYWLNCFSEQLEQIRIELGLPVTSEYTRPPSDQWIKCFHCTIGNKKGVGNEP